MYTAKKRTPMRFKKYGMNDELVFGRYGGCKVKDLIKTRDGLDYIVWADCCADLFDLKPYAREQVEKRILLQFKREKKIKRGYLYDIVQKAGV